MIRRVTESELPLCLRVIHEAFGTVAEEFGLTPDNCPTNGASVFPVPCAETAKRRIPAIHFQAVGPVLVGGGSWYRRQCLGFGGSGAVWRKPLSIDEKRCILYRFG